MSTTHCLLATSAVLVLLARLYSIADLHLHKSTEGLVTCASHKFNIVGSGGSFAYILKFNSEP